MSLQTGSGTYAHKLDVRKDDLYETPPAAVRALLSVERFEGGVWEPACGPGAIVRELEAASHDVVASDLVAYEWDHASGVDFLMELQPPFGVRSIITNPPFKLAEEFAAKAIDLVPSTAMLLRLAFLEGLRWQDRGLATHLAAVWVFAPRLPFMHRANYDGPVNSNSGMPFAWFVWRRDHVGAPHIGWLNWRKFQ